MASADPPQLIAIERGRSPNALPLDPCDLGRTVMPSIYGASTSRGVPVRVFTRLARGFWVPGDVGCGEGAQLLSPVSQALFPGVRPTARSTVI